MSEMTERKLASAMLGEASVSVDPDYRFAPGTKPVLRLTKVSITDERGAEQLSDATLDICGGEIVGAAALEGAAASVLRVIAGRQEPSSGEITRPELIGFVPEDRQHEAIIPDFTLSENMALRNAGARSGLMNWTRIEQQAAAVVREYGVRTQAVDVPIANLSGGNQQRFVLGREMIDKPSLLVLENPTQGLDIHATNAVHDRIRAAATAGTAVVIYSSDLDELVELCSRVVVVGGGKLTITPPQRDIVGEVLLSVES
jgi:simple sugar transport system ATP-binding protein